MRSERRDALNASRAAWSNAWFSDLVMIPRFSRANIAASSAIRLAIISWRSPLFHGGSSALCGHVVLPAE